MKFTLEDGQTEVELLALDAVELQSLSKMDRQATTFQQAFAPVAKVAEEMISSLSGVGSPDEIEINFGAKAGASGGFFGIAKAQGDASISIKLKWKKPS